MIKWILIIILVVAIMMIAYSVSEQIKDKYDFFNNLKQFLNEFKINLAFRQEKIDEFLKKNNSKKQFKIFIEEYSNFLKTGELCLEKIKVLEDEDKQMLQDIVKNIGKYDAKNEINQMESFLLMVDEKLA